MSASAVFGGIGLVLQVAKYKATLAGGKATQQFYDAQARNERLKGRVEAVEAKEKGNDILRRAKAALAANIAGGYASAVIPTKGSARVYGQQQILRPAALDFGITQEESILAIEQANRQASYLEYRGQMARSQAKSQAIGGLLMGVTQAGLSGAFDFGLPKLTSSSSLASPGIAGNVSQINTAGTSSVMSAVALPGQAAFGKSIAGGAAPISGNYGVFNTAGGGMNFII